jgi:hypothetical protein
METNHKGNKQQENILANIEFESMTSWKHKTKCSKILH